MQSHKIHTIVFHIPPKDVSEEELRNIINGLAEKFGIKPQPPRSATSYTLSTGKVLNAHQIAQLSDKLIERSKEKLIKFLHKATKFDHVCSDDCHTILICADPDFIAIAPSIPNPDGFQRLTCTCNGDEDCHKCPIRRTLLRINAEVRDELDID